MALNDRPWAFGATISRIASCSAPCARRNAATAALASQSITVARVLVPRRRFSLGLKRLQTTRTLTRLFVDTLRSRGPRSRPASLSRLRSRERRRRRQSRNQSRLTHQRQDYSRRSSRCRAPVGAQIDDAIVEETLGDRQAFKGQIENFDAVVENGEFHRLKAEPAGEAGF